MFDNLKSRSYFLLAGLNLIWIPTVYLFYPETRNRSLESIEALFSTPSPFYWKMEQAYQLRGGVLVEEDIDKAPGESKSKRTASQELPHQEMKSISSIV